MAKLKYRLTNDILFKLFFVKYPEFLMRLIALILRIPLDDIKQFQVSNPEIQAEEIGGKMCRLDIAMRVNDQRVNLEIQVGNEYNYDLRSLYYWAREFSAALPERGEYADLPRVIVISILGFNLFTCKEYYSEYRAMEVSRHTQLTDRMLLCYYELRKLPVCLDGEDELMLWMHLFKAATDPDLDKLISLGGSVMASAVQAYRSLTTDEQFRELERMRSKALHDEASALGKARREATAKADAKWQSVVAEKDSALAEKDAIIAKLLAEPPKKT